MLNNNVSGSDDDSSGSDYVLLSAEETEEEFNPKPPEVVQDFVEGTSDLLLEQFVVEPDMEANLTDGWGQEEQETSVAEVAAAEKERSACKTGGIQTGVDATASVVASGDEIINEEGEDEGVHPVGERKLEPGMEGVNKRSYPKEAESKEEDGVGKDKDNLDHGARDCELGSSGEVESAATASNENRKESDDDSKSGLSIPVEQSDPKDEDTASVVASGDESTNEEGEDKGVHPGGESKSEQGLEGVNKRSVPKEAESKEEDGVAKDKDNLDRGARDCELGSNGKVKSAATANDEDRKDSDDDSKSGLSIPVEESDPKDEEAPKGRSEPEEASVNLEARDFKFGTRREVNGAAAVFGVAGLVIWGPIAGVVSAAASAHIAANKPCQCATFTRRCGGVLGNVGNKQQLEATVKDPGAKNAKRPHFWDKITNWLVGRGEWTERQFAALRQIKPEGHVYGAKGGKTKL